MVLVFKFIMFWYENVIIALCTVAASNVFKCYKASPLFLSQGMTLEPGKLYTEVMGDEVHLSMATLESRKDFVPGNILSLYRGFSRDVSWHTGRQCSCAKDCRVLVTIVIHWTRGLQNRERRSAVMPVKNLYTDLYLSSSLTTTKKLPKFHSAQFPYQWIAKCKLSGKLPLQSLLNLAHSVCCASAMSCRCVLYSAMLICLALLYM